MYSKTVDGIEMDLWNLDPRIVTVEHIAFVLARINRFAGHWKHPISVARHCLQVADELKDRGYPYGVQLQGLFHDADEAYTQDIPSPLKGLLMIQWPNGQLWDYREFEGDLRQRIFAQMGLPWPIDPAVHAVDQSRYDVEIPVIRGETRGDNNDHNVVERLFVYRARDLMEQCGVTLAPAGTGR